MSEHPLVATHTDHHNGPRGVMTPAERQLSVGGGAALLLHGWYKGGLSGALQVAAGAYAVFRGATGHCALKQALTPTPFEERFSIEHDWPVSEAIMRSVTINRPLDEVREFIKAEKNVGPLLRWVDRVEETGPDTTRWTLRAPAGRRLHCTLIRTASPEDASVLQWKTPDGSSWQHSVSVSLEPALTGRATQVKAVVVCKPAMGKLGYGLARAIGLFSDKALLNALRAIKQQLETGEVTTNRLRPDDDRDFFYVHASTETDPAPEKDDAAVKTGVAIERGVV
ncbi:SRPBCC family protein [Pseudomonas syringae]|nr:SRPBCC family protein [Pseudomonas syringae]MBD8790725.1 SRPBCC family protein [Pseudomonas syringae]MBD8798963.1 SRPBCC family protein [Pseudomonas syringae]MBD8809790.1 SRPBCC family protein [Pseudomonas syringae]